MGLVGYASSDEEEDEAPRAQVKPTVTSKEAIPAPTIEASHDAPVPIGPLLPPPEDDPTPYGPQLGPQPQPQPSLDTSRAPSQDPADADADARALIHSLTLPAVPDLSIPPSPPGSPPPGCNAKFEKFLELKRQGTHFNHKLQASAALRNPSLMDKLLAYAGVDDAAQYDTTLPPELWDPRALPEWAFRDKLRRSRERVAKRKQGERAAGGRTAVEFVPAVNPPSAEGSGAGGLSRRDERGDAWK